MMTTATDRSRTDEEEVEAESRHPPPVNGESGLFSWLPSWRPTSEQCLIDAETQVLGALKSDYTDHYVPISDNAFIRTLSMVPEQNPVSNNTIHPLVMVHGFGCGLAAFYKNYDYLHSKRHLYSFDVLGFGRSSRISFSSDAELAENEFVESFEKWREAMGLEKVILMGHSLGAFMCTSYAMKYPERVRHLILEDAWGFPAKPDTEDWRRLRRYRFIVPVVQSYFKVFNPFAIVRALGPYGPSAISRFRSDLQEKFGSEFMDYVYHCNAQTPSGEEAFSYMHLNISYARRPMLDRLDSLPASIPISMLLGTRSWFDNSTGEKVYSKRPDSFVDIHFIKEAGHHIHADLPEVFNSVINDICKMVDNDEDTLRNGETRRDERTAFHYH